MNIGLIDVDGCGLKKSSIPFPNIALGKLARWHRQNGDDVGWYNTFDHYDVVYMSKVFNFTPDYGYIINNADKVVKGGTGYDITTTLPDEIDRLQPDYSMFPYIDDKTAYGFTTRGCIRSCKFCVVSQKEGMVRPYMDVDEIAIEGRTNLILMDNNVLASDYGLEQMEKTIRRKYKVDYNQALDARLVTEDIAELLAKVKWLRYIRFGCDTPHQVEDCEKAIEKIRKYGYKKDFILYCILLDDFDEAFGRINYWREKADWKIAPYCQPFRDPNRLNTPPQWQKDLSRWVNRKEFYKSTEFKDFEPRKGFRCSEYFK